VSESLHSLTRRNLLRDAARRGAAAAIAASGIGLLSGTAAGAGSGIARPSRPSPHAPAAADDADQYDILLARVKFASDTSVPDVWNTHPGAERNLLEALANAVRCKVKLPQGVNCDNPYYGEERHFNAVVDFDGAANVEDYPFLVMTAEGYFKFTASQKANLKKYLDGGGFVFMDDCIAGVNTDFFYQSAYKLLEEVHGRGSVRRVPNEHEVFHNVFDLGKIGLPHISGVNHGAQGIWRGDRLAVILSSTDVHCGWTDRQHRWYQGGNGRHTHEEAIKFGINMIMYVLSH